MFNKQKKGSMYDIMFVSFTLLMAILVVGIGIFIFNSVSDTTDIMDYNENTEYIESRTRDTFKTFDFMIVFVYFGAIIVSGLLAYLLRNSWIFMVIYIILFLFVLFSSTIITNILESFVLDETIGASILANMPISYHIFSNLVIYNLIFGSILIILMVAFSGGADKE